jgi:hypothetical protein
MPYLEDVIVTKSYHKKTGESKYGTWNLYNIYVDDPDWKDICFTYFQSGKKPTPERDMKIKKLLFEEEENEGFTNYSVKTIELEGQKEKPKPKPKPKSQSQPKQNGKEGFDPIWMAVSYVKDLECERIKKGKELSITLKDHVMGIAQASKLLYRLMQEKDEPAINKDPFEEEPPLEDDPTSFPIPDDEPF